VNDADALLVNAWRAIQWHPDATADAASWPVSEYDKHARSCALLKWRADENPARLAGDPLWCDPVMAGWWVWAVSVSLGGIWGQRGAWWPDETGRLRKRPRGERDAFGVVGNRPQLTNSQGIVHDSTRALGLGEPSGDPNEPFEYHALTMPEVRRWFRFLSARLRHVRIVNGDWSRVVTPAAALILPTQRPGGSCGVFVDPPYSAEAERATLYGEHDSFTVAGDVRAWALKHGDDPRWRIVYAGFDVEGADLESAGWTPVEWFTGGFMRGGLGLLGKNGHQQTRERLWLSPHCRKPNDAATPTLF
jgi:hypothetical protein